ncbi:hypothetical protein SAMN05216462_3021 [Xylanibacter ruminicola]|uniref:Lipoprotein n=1 Tax=Xylanibacter ruminicola TaxID=839 RepID=A0A1H4EWS6_XYLRU|nr:hypothetical protein [Xylanibacter ruminicola]SEA89445.1 hypothetical protein SAMN05216462_3021 [Xylanibacter ruminicola]
MKKKFINGILMVALVAATSTSFVSCKDNDTDVDLIGQIGNVRSDLQTKINDLNTRLGDLDTQLGKLDGKVDQEITDRKNAVTALDTRLQTAEGQLTTLTTETLPQLQDEVDAIDTAVGEQEDWIAGVLNNLVTSIENVATYSPLMGQVVLPGATPNILAAYFGEAAVKGSFPASDINITEVAPVKWSAGATLGEGEKGYAGTVYLTINKYFNSIEGINFALVNTAGEEAPVELNVEASDKVIYAGYTRAAENNFYEANATISSIDDVKVNLNLPTLKADIKQIWNDRNRKTGTSATALAQLAADLYATQLGKFPVYGVRASWQDVKKTTTKDAEGKATTTEEKSNHFVTSKPEIVVAAVKPLSYSFDLNQLPGQTYKTEGIEAIEKLYNKIIDKVVAKFPTVTVNPISIVIDDNKGAGTYSITIPTTSPINATGSPVVIDITDAINSVMSDLNGDLALTTADINAMLDQVEQLNNLKAQVAGTKETFASYLNRVVNKFEKLFTNNLNRALQPTLLAIQSDNTINRVSGIKTNPLVCGANTELFPTSYSVEYFAPAYKKFVVVTEIDGKKATAADNKTLGENLGVILESGNNQKVTISPAAGKTYTVVYSAVDYQGVVRTNTYYVTGK